MPPLRLCLALLLVAPVARAQTAPAPAPAPAAETPKPSPSCPCEKYGFTPLTDKARAVVAYWDARKKAEISVGVSGVFALLALAANDGNTLRDAQAAHEQAVSELIAARIKAEDLGALKVTDDMEGPIEFRIEQGKDYVIKR